MTEQPTLFDQEPEVDAPETECGELRADDGAPCCCRYCRTATTAAGIVNRGHGPDSPECARMLAWIEAL